jgi:hypothetical protein
MVYLLPAFRADTVTTRASSRTASPALTTPSSAYTTASPTCFRSLSSRTGSITSWHFHYLLFNNFFATPFPGDYLVLEHKLCHQIAPINNLQKQDVTSVNINL